MRRRLAAIGLAMAAAVVPPGPAAGQQAVETPRVGVLLYSSPTGDPNARDFVTAMGRLGYVDGRSVELVYRFAEGRSERLPALAAELVRLKPDVVLALGGDVALPAKRAAADTVPVVFIASGDPIRGGLVGSLARPGGSATGMTLLAADLAGKRLGLLMEAVPRVRKLAILWNPEHADDEYKETLVAATALGLRLQSLEIRSASDLDTAFAAAGREEIEAVIAVSSRQMLLHREAIGRFAERQRIPLIGGWGAWAQAGALMTYGPKLPEVVGRAAAYVDRILKGAKPGDLPVEQPTTFDLVINLKTAKALGIEVPQSLLARADEVIE